jgi:predicted DNA-binding ribbon-helix-helix protein
MSTNQLIARLYDEIVEYRGEVDNFASFLRVTCLRYLSLRPAKRGRPPRSIVERLAARPLRAPPASGCAAGTASWR